MRFDKPLVIGITGIAACVMLSACREGESVAARQPEPEVNAITIQARPVQLSTTLPGRTRANVVAEIRPQVGGVLMNRAFQEGAEVKQGQLLYKIDPAPYRAAMLRAQASFESAKALLRRYETLVKSRAISQQEYDDARSQFLQAQAALESARIDLGYTDITAPISGRIGRSTVTKGALVTANQSAALATVQQLDPIYVDIVQPSISLLQLKQDIADGLLKTDDEDRANIHLVLENGRKYEYTGKLQFSEVSVNESTGSVTLRAIFPNPKETLLPGMFVRAELEEGTRENAVLVPQRAVSRDSQGMASIYELNSDDTVKLSGIKTERSIDGQWLVSSGLVPGARVVVDGIQHVQPGIKVKVSNTTLESKLATTQHGE